MHSKKSRIVVAEGDGIGPEIMGATLEILKAAGALLEISHIEIGEKVYLKGCRTGIEPSSWELLRSSQAFLKGPITTPQGGGFKSLNVTVRTTLGLYANIRPCISYYPFVETKHPGMDLVIVRENEEDLYTGIEYRQTQDTFHALKIMTESGSEKIIRYAFEYAVANERKKVTCFTKDNILKMSDGIFHKTFDRIAKEYPKIENEHWIIDIGAAKLADTPNLFDVVVLPNLYGDILSDVAAQISGSVGLAGSANIGVKGAMFEAIHGSAPRRAGQNMANPSGLLLAAVAMLVHLDQPEVAMRIHNAWLCTLEQGIHTYDIFKEGTSKQKVGTKEFAAAVIKNLGKLPHELKAVHYGHSKTTKHHEKGAKQGADKKELVGVDIYLDSHESVKKIESMVSRLVPQGLQLSLIANRGVALWPQGSEDAFCSDTWRCRFLAKERGCSVSHEKVIELLKNLADVSIDFTQIQNLYSFAGVAGYTLAPNEQ